MAKKQLVKVKALRNHPYGGKYRRKGEVYEINEKDLKLLSAVKAVEVVADEPEPVAEKTPNEKKTTKKTKTTKGDSSQDEALGETDSGDGEVKE